MDCTTFNARLPDWLDESLDAESANALCLHAGQCGDCSRALAAERKLRLALQTMPAPRPRPGFAREAIRLAHLANGSRDPGERRRDALFALAGAAAAGVGMLAVLLVRGPFSGPAAVVPVPLAVQALDSGPGLQTVAMTIGQVEPVRLRIDSPRDFEEVRFSVELPDHVWIADQPGLLALSWSGHLRKGENVLELPLVAQASASGVMTARVSWGAQEQRIQAELIARAGEHDGVDEPDAGEGT